MRTLALLCLLGLAACSSKTITQTAPDFSDLTLLEFHWFFELYQTSVDSTEERIIKTYDELNLVRVQRGMVNTYIIQGDTVFIGNHTDSEYQVELYKQDYLVISMVKGRSGVAGPDYFPRDSTLFINFKTGAIKTASLRSIYFTRSQKFLNMAFNPIAADSPGSYFAIVSIDFENDQLTLVGRNGLKYTHPLKSYEGVYRFGL